MSLTKSPTSSATPRKAAKKKTEPAALATMNAVTAPSHDEIAKRAYALFESRGFVDGLYEEDWLQAERELVSMSRG